MIMLSYSFDHTPSTNSSSTVCVPALGAAVLLTGMLLASIPSESTAPHRIDRYDVPQLNGTFSQLQNPFTGEYTKQSDFDFAGSLTTFYATLLGQQEPLGAEFEKVLYDNLWELYDD
jgi:hypothetical protein